MYLVPILLLTSQIVINKQIKIIHVIGLIYGRQSLSLMLYDSIRVKQLSDGYATSNNRHDR